MSNRLSKQAQQERYNLVQKEYETEKCLYKIGRKLNLNRHTIKRALVSNGVSVTKYTDRESKIKCDLSYFEKIDSEEKAYFLGFISADGSVFKNTLRIEIQVGDIEILEKFKISLKSDHKITFLNRISRGKESNTCAIALTNRKIAKDLEKYGIIRNKTGQLNWNKIIENIPYHLVRDFVRGFLDGDGGINKRTEKEIAVSFYEKGAFYLKGIKEFLMSEGLASKASFYLNKNGVSVYSIAGRKNLCKFYKIIYEKSSISLKRKRDKIENYLFPTQNLSNHIY